MSDTTATTTRSFEGLTIPAPGAFAIDASHSSVEFVARHLMVSKVRGRFDAFSGTITVAEDALASSVEVTIDVASVNTGEEGRDQHLRSGDFFDADQHPALTFRSTAVRHVGGSEFEVDGELTIKGVQRPITLPATFEGVAGDPWGGQRVAFESTIEIDREEYGLTWNQALETGGVLVSKKVKIELAVQAVRQA